MKRKPFTQEDRSLPHGASTRPLRWPAIRSQSDVLAERRGHCPRGDGLPAFGAGYLTPVPPRPGAHGGGGELPADVEDDRIRLSG